MSQLIFKRGPKLLQKIICEKNHFFFNQIYHEKQKNNTSNKKTFKKLYNFIFVPLIIKNYYAFRYYSNEADDYVGLHFL